VLLGAIHSLWLVNGAPEGERFALPPFSLAEIIIFQNTMKLSRYTKIFPSAADKDSAVLYSTKRASAVLVPQGLIDDINNQGLAEEEKEALAGFGLLAPDDEEEKQELLHFIEKMNGLNKKLEYIVVLNLDCNLGCKYCFEGTRKGKHYLSDETAAQFVAFVKRSALSNKEELRITFYGGEPLLSVDRIAGLSEQIGSFAKEKGLTYCFSLVTNGTLLTPPVVKRLAPLGLKSAKVTLDGPKEVHDKFRPFKTGAGSFDVIVRNVRDVCGMVKVQLGGNYTRDNYREFPRLLDHLSDKGLTPDKIPLIKFEPVVNESSEFAPPDFHDGCNSPNEPWVSEAGLFLREEVLKRGYDTQRLGPMTCAMQLRDSFVVNYDGTLYKCPGLIGRPGLSAGSVAAGVAEYHETHGLDDWKNEECLSCRYLPICFGGCKYMTLQNTGAMNGIDCKKQYFDRTLGELVAQDIRYNL